VAESNGLENRHTFTGIESSNLSPSATLKDWVSGGIFKPIPMEFTQDVKNEAASVLKAFKISTFERNKIRLLVKLAKRHSRLAETLAVKTRLSEKQHQEMIEIQKQIKELCEGFGLNVDFEIRPNGWTVRLWDKQKTIFNYYGGSSNGYGIGKP
jgi:hypothetical protein